MAQKSKSRQDSNRLSELLVRNEKVAVGLIVAVALVLRVWHLFQMKTNDPFFLLPSVDPKVYHEWAIAISQGDIFGDRVFFLSPLYPYFLAVIYSVFGPGFFVGKLVQMLLGVMSCVLVYIIGKRVFSIQVGFFAALFFAGYSTMIFYEGILLVAGLQTPLNLICIILLLGAADRRSFGRWMAAGVVLGLSALARPNVLLLGGFVLTWIFFMTSGRAMTKQKILLSTVFAVGIGLVVFPVTLRNWLVGDDVVLVSSQGGVNFYIGNGPDANGVFIVPSVFPMTRADDPIQQEQAYRKFAEKEIGRELKPSEVSAFWSARTWDYIAENPGKWIKILALKCGLFVNHYEQGNSRDFYSSRDFSTVLRLPLPGFGFLGALGLLGMVLAWKRRREAFFLYAMVATYMVSFVIFFVLAHYRMPVTPFFALFAALAVCRLGDTLKKRRIGPLVAASLGLAALVAFVNTDFDNTSRSRFMIHYNLGNKYRLMEKDDLAIQAYKRSIEENARYISAHNNLALVYERDRKNYGLAIETWRRVFDMARRRGDRHYMERAQRHIVKLEEVTGRRASPGSRKKKVE
ncbi:MAG: hypothetical protein GY854_15105 [Deltaproteobacteria bacterium]|nr:hypothetical protein [Deltaproteobacteria bacterium]